MKVPGVFTNSSETRQEPAGSVIFEEGDAGTEMYGIISGQVELRASDGYIATLEPEDVFGEMALIDQSKRMATATATTDTELAVINRHLFLFLITETPMFALQVMSTIAARLREQHAHTSGQ